MDTTAAERDFVERLEAHRGLLMKVATAYCPDVAQREDLMQDIVVQLWSSRKRFDGRVKFSTWTYRIALNVAISAYRRQSRRPVAFELDERFAESRPSLDAEAVIVLYLDDRPYSDIADILGISESNVGTKIGRIKQRLRRELSLFNTASP